MKKFFVMMAMMLAAFTANAFEFDGIDLNMPYSKVAREISARGYAYNTQRVGLDGDWEIDIFGGSRRESEAFQKS